MDKALKQRLVGATVLITLAVVVLPMLLGGRPESRQEAREIELPPRPSELSFETRRFPVGEQDSSAPSSLPVQSVEESPLPAPSTPAQVQPQVQSESPAPVEPTVDASPADPGDAGLVAATEAPAEAPVEVLSQPETTPAPITPSADEGRYLVQVASFSSVANAQRLSERLRQGGEPVLNDTVQSDAGILHRVRLGPFASKNEADRVVRKITDEMSDLRPRVLDLRPEQGAQVTEPSDPMVRWVVQVGSFSNSENAEQLVFRLRDAGYRASSAAVTANGATAFKVRVGPVIEREDAVALAAKLNDELGIKGLVMSAD